MRSASSHRRSRLASPVPPSRPPAFAYIVGLTLLVAACGGDDTAEGPEWVGDIRRAVEAVESELGDPQQFFEVTATPSLVNMFVAIDDATLAVPFIYVEGSLEPPAPPLAASGNVFTAEAIALDEDRILASITDELPDATIDALSVEGGPGGSVRYVAAVRSSVGGVLDVELGADGTVLAVNPL